MHSSKKRAHRNHSTDKQTPQWRIYEYVFRKYVASLQENIYPVDAF